MRDKSERVGNVKPEQTTQHYFSIVQWQSSFVQVRPNNQCRDTLLIDDNEYSIEYNRYLSSPDGAEMLKVGTPQEATLLRKGWRNE